ADVVARLVVEVTRVLRREQDPEPTGARAAEQIEHRLLRRWRADRGYVGVGLVEERDRLQLLRRALAREAGELDEQTRHPELQDRDLGEPGRVDDREAGPVAGGWQQRADVERLAVAG